MRHHFDLYLIYDVYVMALLSLLKRPYWADFPFRAINFEDVLSSK